MNANNRVRKEQWDLCERCGFPYPMSLLIKQKGAMVCVRTCIDDLTIERRQKIIMDILSVGVDQEGVDTRVNDRSYFDGFSEEIT